MAGFATFDAALRLHDAWDTTLYNGVCFEGRRWNLLVDDGSLSKLPWSGGRRPAPKGFKASAFQRFPIQLRQVSSKTEALRAAQAQGACWQPGVTFLADLRHAGGPTMGIAHFAKRILRLYGLQQAYAGLGVDRIVFPATSAAHLAHSWPASMLQLLGHDQRARGDAHLVNAAALLRQPCCFEHLMVSSRENTYFTRFEDADALRRKAHALAGVPAASATCARPVACYFQRAEGAPGGKWEGGPRTVVNREAVQQRMRALLPRGEVRIVSANSSHSFAEQVRLFASCDLLVSVHGSHNANIMWMRPGSAFMEVNPHKFYYASYNQLATVAGVLFLHSRRNSIALGADSPLKPKADAFARRFARFDDHRCQEHNLCRGQSRSFPTRVNLTDFDLEFKRGVDHVLGGCDGAHAPAAPAPAGGEAAPAQSFEEAVAAALMVGASSKRGGGRKLRQAAAPPLPAAAPAAAATVRGDGDGAPPPHQQDDPMQGTAELVPHKLPRRLRAAGARGGKKAGGGRARLGLPKTVVDVGEDAGGGEGGAGAAAGGVGGGAGGAAGVGRGGLRVAVCVTGQLSRLELTSKVANLLRPTAALRPAALHVFLALEQGSHLFSNLDFGAILAQQHGGCGREMRPDEVKAQLGEFFGGASYVNHTTRAVDMSQWRRYRRDRPMVERTTRLQHHLSQFVHMRTCAKLIEAREVRDNTHYDVIVKTRDNTLAITPFAVTAAHARGPTLSKKCVEWGGYNDKAMIIPRRFMDGALRSVSEDFFIAPKIGKGIPNSERLLRAVLDRNRVQVKRVSAEQIPLVDGRCSAQGWCLVEEGKDCRPATWPWPTKPCEVLNASQEQRGCLYKNRFLARAEVQRLCSVKGLSMNDAR